MVDNAKREKVIKGLECCIKDGACYYTDKCPYRNEKRGCKYVLNCDALVLLKAQWPKLVRITATINYRKIGECPNCSNPINSGDYPRYCGDCGQAVKWDD